MYIQVHIPANRNNKKQSLAEIIKHKLSKVVPLLLVALILSACAALSGRESAGEYIDDASITASVKNKILQDPKLNGFQIHVETFHNQVQLSGFVDTHNESARAGQIAREVAGVQDVKNSIVVRKHKHARARR